MALTKTKQRLNSLETAYQRADQRLDRIGPALVEALDDLVVEHQGGRTSSVTTTAQGYEVLIDNNPFSPTITLRATEHDIPNQRWSLRSSKTGDFDAIMLEEMEKWTVGAKTGIPVDDLRHLSRADAINHA